MLTCPISKYRLVVLVLVVTSTAANRAAVVAQETKVETVPGQAELFKNFESLLNGVKLVGRFTVIGRDPNRTSQEEYTIRSVKKLPEGDYWLFNTRIKYGDHDVTLPLPLQVKWAGDTPIITLTELTIPGLGTFSSRVIIYNNKYAGTWTHGDVGGHLFGVVEKLEESEQNAEKTDREAE
jgi:hypothetical protein